MFKQVVKQLKPQRLFDIAANLTDQSFGSQKRADDRNQVVQRAKQVGCSHLLIAAGCIQDAKMSYQLCHRFENSFCTIGVHPCRASQPFDKKKAGSVEEYFAKMDQYCAEIKDRLVAIGQCGLDYDRLNYSSKQEQNTVFPFHFDLAEKYKLPLYLHNRNTGDDFYELIRKNRDRFSSGVVHSFTGTLQQVKKIVDLDLYIGINGCSFKTQQNIQVLKMIPVDRIMLQTDAPYCDIKASHAGHKYVKTKFQLKNKQTQGFLLKGRNQPCRIVQVVQVASAVMGIPQQQLCQIAFNNAVKLFNCK